MKKLTFLIFCSLLMVSCAVYNPHAVDVPLIQGKGDLRVDAGASMSFPAMVPSANITGSYGFTNFLSGQLHMDFNDEGCYYFQGAAGLYKPYGNFVLEGYAGAGIGGRNFTREGTNYERLYNAYYQLYYGQLNMGYVNLANGHIDIGLGLKLGSLASDMTCTFIGLEPGKEREPKYYKGNNLLFEPQFVIRFGGPQVKFGIHLAYTELADWDDTFFYHEPFSVGVSCNLNF